MKTERESKIIMALKRKIEQKLSCNDFCFFLLHSVNMCVSFKVQNFVFELTKQSYGQRNNNEVEKTTTTTSKLKEINNKSNE